MKKIVYMIALILVVAAVLSAAEFAGKISAGSDEIQEISEKITPAIALTAIVSTDSTSSKVVDVVCKMKVGKSVKDKSVYKGKTYYFCAPYCKKEFDKNPKKYISS